MGNLFDIEVEVDDEDEDEVDDRDGEEIEDFIDNVYFDDIVDSGGMNDDRRYCDFDWRCELEVSFDVEK